LLRSARNDEINAVIPALRGDLGQQSLNKLLSQDSRLRGNDNLQITIYYLLTTIYELRGTNTHLLKWHEDC